MKKINEDKMAFMQDILGIQTEMGVEMLRAACECIQLFDSKQLDYGSSNIALGGEMGHRGAASRQGEPDAQPVAETTQGRCEREPRKP